MKKILATIVLIMSLFMTPLFAADIDKTSEQGKKIKAILEESARKKAEFEERKREEDLAIKTREELEARKQQELQKKLDELKAQAEKAQEEKAREKEAAEKKTQEEQEVAKQKKLAEDPRKNIADALGDLFAANKKYAAADAETDAAKKAAYIRSGDVLFNRSVIELHDALNAFSIEEVEKIVTSMELKPETQFMILRNLIEAYVDHQKILDAAHEKVLGDFIRVLFATVNVDILQKFLMTEAGPKVLHEVQVMMLPMAETSGEGKFFDVMFPFTGTLVELLNKSNIDQRKQMSAVLLDWVRAIPVTYSYSADWLAKTFRGLKAESVMADVSGLRDWLYIFKKSEDNNFLKMLGQKYLKAVYEDGHFGTLRDALMVFRRVLDGIIPSAEEVRLKIAFLKKAAQEDVLRAMSDNDRSAVLKYLAEYITAQGTEAPMIWTVMANNLDAVITSIEAERANTAGTKRFADLGEQLKQLQAMEKQLGEIYSPSWFARLSTAGRLAWHKVAKAWKGEEKSFVPNFESWNEEEIGRVFFNLTDENYKNYKFSSVDEFIKSLSTLRDAVKWYADFPEVQAFLKKWAQNFYYANKTFTNLSSVEIANFLARSRDMQDIFFSDYIHASDSRQDLDMVVWIARDFVDDLIYHKGKHPFAVYKVLVDRISKFALERFIAGRGITFFRLGDYGFASASGQKIEYEFLDNLNNDAFAVFIKLFPEWELKYRRYMASKPVHEVDDSFNKKRSVWYAKLLSFTQKIDPRRALALLDVFESLNQGLKANKLEAQFSDYGLKAARIAIEERLKAQQESESKEAKAISAQSSYGGSQPGPETLARRAAERAAAELPASTSSASSGIAPSASASSSSANITASGSTSSTSLSVPALSRGIGALTQSRS